MHKSNSHFIESHQKHQIVAHNAVFYMPRDGHSDFHMVWNTGYIFAWGRKDKDLVDEERSAYGTDQTSSGRTEVSMHTSNSFAGSQVKHAKARSRTQNYLHY